MPWVTRSLRDHPDAFDEIRFVLFCEPDFDTYRAAAGLEAVGG